MWGPVVEGGVGIRYERDHCRTPGALAFRRPVERQDRSQRAVRDGFGQVGDWAPISVGPAQDYQIAIIWSGEGIASVDGDGAVQPRAGHFDSRDVFDGYPLR